MKILHINSYYADSLFYKKMYDKQIKDNLDIVVFVSVSKNRDTSNLDLGKYTYISHNHGKYDRLLFHLKHSKIYKDVLNKLDIEDYSLVHAHSLFSNGYIAYKLYRKYDIPYIVAVRNTDINIFFKKMIHLRKLGISILKNAKQIIFISDTYKDYLFERFIPLNYKEELLSKSTIIPNGIDNFWLDNKFDNRNKPDKKNINLLYVGVVNKNKNIKTTIRACKQLLEEGFNIKYTIVGAIKDEDEKESIETNSFIIYKEHVNKEELMNYYRDSDIFVMPSILETFGLVYIEAMSQGLPVIYTKGQGFDGQFKDGEVGYSVDSNSPTEIAQNIKLILENYDEISNNCLVNVDKFNWEKICSLYEDIYNSIDK